MMARQKIRLLFVTGLLMTTGSLQLAASEQQSLCILERQEFELFSRTDATVSFQKKDGHVQISLFGTHQDPTRTDRWEPTWRQFALSRQEQKGSLDAWLFWDDRTAGVLSFDYSGTARLSLHVQGVDYAYMESFQGDCGGAI